MPTDKHTTKVIFRTWRKGGDVIALFPEVPGTHAYDCSSYQHTGQHGPACPSIVHRATRPATAQEIKPLAKELRRIGYRLQMAKRFHRNALQIRKQQMKIS